jgi:hypothetical protein
LFYKFLVQMTYKHCHNGGADINLNNAPAFTPGQPGVCQLGDVRIDQEIQVPEVTTLLGIDPGKLNIFTLSTGPKLMGPDYYAA